MKVVPFFSTFSTPVSSFRSLVGLMSLFLVLLPQVKAARFQVQGPILTVTLKDPETDSSSSSSSDMATTTTRSSSGKWLNLSNLRPNLMWSIQSQSRPLPNWLPSLQSCQATIGYQYDGSGSSTDHLPTFLDGEVKFTAPKDITVQIQPSYEFRSKRNMVLFQISRGTAYLTAKFGNHNNNNNENNSNDNTKSSMSFLEVIKGCYQINLPYASVGAIRMTPTWNVLRGEPTCLLEATTGSQRTKAVLNLEYQNPTLTIVHAVDERHVIAPEISLYNAKIVYQWNIDFDSGSIRTKVDPTSAVHVTWTDKSMTGKWVTDVRLPLAGTTLSALAADVRVRRQFTF